MADRSPTTRWQALRRQPLAMAGLAVLSLLTLFSVLGPVVLPDPNRQEVAFARLPPGSVRQLAHLDGRTLPLCDCPAAAVRQPDGTWRLTTASGTVQTAPASTRIETRRYPLGTDSLGRDLLARLAHGGRVSLGVGFLAVLLSVALGVTLGALSGYFGGWVDAAIQWVMAVLWALPSLLLAIAIAFAVGRGYTQLFLAVGLTIWVEVARLIRGETLSLKTRTYVQAARSMGFGHRHLIVREILPNLTGPIIVLATANFATAILLEAGLSFLGLGVAPPTPSWGSMVYEGYTYLLVRGGTWLALWPGLLLVLTITSLHLVGLGLREASE